MGRRSDHTRDELRAMLLAAAEETIREEGFRAVTARALAKQIGYSVGTVYNLFESLDDLILEVNGRTLDALHESLTTGATGENVEETLRGFARAYVTFATENRHKWNALFEHSMAPGGAVSDGYLRKVNRLFELVEAALAPLFADADTKGRRKSALILWSSLHGICSLALAGKLDLVAVQGISEMADSLVETYLAGLRA
jgi:AcrR family transcriptional regulator